MILLKSLWPILLGAAVWVLLVFFVRFVVHRFKRHQ